MKKLSLALLILLVLNGCDVADIGGCAEYASKHSCDHVKNKATYNVLFYFPSYGSESKEFFIGTTKGLQQCGEQARSYAFQKGRGKTDYDWGYVCCMQTKDSFCGEKHR